MTAWVAGSSSARANASVSAALNSLLMALSLSGRFIVMIPTLSSVSYSTSSVTRDLLTLANNKGVHHDAAVWSRFDRIEVDFRNVFGIEDGKVGKRIETVGHSLHVGRRPAAQWPKQRRATGLRNHLLGVSFPQGQAPQREVPHRLHGDT